jgi:hypothetical protein
MKHKIINLSACTCTAFTPVLSTTIFNQRLQQIPHGNNTVADHLRYLLIIEHSPMAPAVFNTRTYRRRVLTYAAIRTINVSHRSILG